MDTTTAPPPCDDARTGSTPRSRRRLGALAVAIAVVLGGAGWWLTHPDRLEPVGSSSVLPLEVGQPAVVGMFAQPRTGAVTLTDVTPHVRENSADAELRVRLCETAPGEGKVGSKLGRAEDACDAVSDPAGHDLAPRQQRYLVLEVVPRRPGTVVVDGLDVSYRDGWRRGTQRSGLEATFPVDDDS